MVITHRETPRQPARRPVLSSYASSPPNLPRAFIGLRTGDQYGGNHEVRPHGFTRVSRVVNVRCLGSSSSLGARLVSGLVSGFRSRFFLLSLSLFLPFSFSLRSPGVRNDFPAGRSGLDEKKNVNHFCGHRLHCAEENSVFAPCRSPPLYKSLVTCCSFFHLSRGGSPSFLLSPPEKWALRTLHVNFFHLPRPLSLAGAPSSSDTVASSVSVVFAPRAVPRFFFFILLRRLKMPSKDLTEVITRPSRSFDHAPSPPLPPAVGSSPRVLSPSTRDGLNVNIIVFSSPFRPSLRLRLDDGDGDAFPRGAPFRFLGFRWGFFVLSRFSLSYG